MQENENIKPEKNIICEPSEVEKYLFGFLQSLIREKVLREKGVSE